MASYTSAISPTSLTLDVGESGEVRIGLNVQVSGSGFDISADDSSIASVSWSTTGAKTVSVTVTGLSPGSTKLTLTNGKTVSVTVNGTSGGGDSGGDSGGDDDDDTGGDSGGSGSGSGSTTPAGFWSTDGTVGNKITSISLKVGETTKVYFSNSVSVTSYTFTSSNSSVVKVSNTSSSTTYKKIVTLAAVAAGSASITASNGTSLSVTVSEEEGGGGEGGDDGGDTPSDSVSISGVTTHYRLDRPTFTATASGNVTWSVTEGSDVDISISTNTSGTTCNISRVTTSGYGPWTYTLNAVCGSATDSHKVEIGFPPMEDLYIDGPDEVAVGTSMQYYYIRATFPEGGSTEDVEWKWTFSGPEHEWVPYPYSDYGYIEFKEAGELKITVEGAEQKATLTVNVVDIPPDDMVFEGVEEADGYDGKITLVKGKSMEYLLRLIPAECRYQPEVENEDTSIAITYPGDIAEGNPLVMLTRGLEVGTTTATVVAGDVSKTLLIEVVGEEIPVTQFIVIPKDIVVKVGRTAHARYTYLPENANSGTYATGVYNGNDFALRIYPTGTIEVTGKREMSEPEDVSWPTEGGVSLEFSVQSISAIADFKIQYKGNGGISSRESDMVSPGEVVILPGASRDENDEEPVFMGWYTSAEGDGMYVGTEGTPYSPVGPITLYARWFREIGKDDYGATLHIADDVGDVHTFHLGSVKGIEDTLSPALTAISTLIYGAENRFVTDTGVQRNINLTLERINPPDYDDDSDDDRRWSNGKWWNEFRDAIDFWQNLASDPFNFERTGGFVIRFLPSDAELYPEIEENIFISGSITPVFAVQKMTYTLPMVVARMTAKSSLVETVKVRLCSNIYLINECLELSFPKGGSFILPPCPTTWISKTGFSFVGWSESANGAPLPQGKPILMDSDKTFYAKYSAFKALVVSSPSAEPTIYGSGVKFMDTTLLGRMFTVTSAEISRVQVVIVGGGGSGGDGEGDIYGGDLGIDNYAGGGGGSGDVKIHTFSISYGSQIFAVSGRGGRSRATEQNSFVDGEDGHESSVRYQSIKMVAGGGSGGKAARPGVASLPDRFSGGARYNPGGAADTITGNGEDGSTSYPNIIANVGKGAKKSGNNRGGGGGGAAALNHSFVIGTPDSYTTYTFTSKGGNGANSGDAGSGEYGGGGGSSPKGDSGRGGDGLVLLAFY